MHPRRRKPGANAHGQEGQDLPLLRANQAPTLRGLGEPPRARACSTEDLVVQQIVAALSAPHLVQSVWDRMQEIRPDLSEPQVVLPMRNLATLWRELYPAEQCRLAQLLIDRVVLGNGGLGRSCGAIRVGRTWHAS